MATDTTQAAMPTIDKLEKLDEESIDNLEPLVELLAPLPGHTREGGKWRDFVRRWVAEVQEAVRALTNDED